MTKTFKFIGVALLLFAACGAAMAAGVQLDTHMALGLGLIGATVPFDTQTRLTQIAMAVKPQGMIADIVCPRVMVDGEKFTYTKLDHSDLFTIPDTQIGRSSEPNQVEFGATDVTDKINDYGLADFVPNRDVNVANAQNANFDPMSAAVEGTSILIDLAREKRVADLYTSLATYNSNLRTTLSGTGQWSDYTNSDPFTVIMDALDGMLVRPNVAVMGRKVFTRLRSHPKLVAAVLNNGGQIAGGTGATGSVSKQAIADLLELDAIHVGESFYNSAKKGQTFAAARLWGNHAAFLRIDPNVKSAQGFSLPTFAMTAQWETRKVRAVDEPKRGSDGGTTLIVAEKVKEIVTFQDGGYFFQNAVA